MQEWELLKKIYLYRGDRKATFDLEIMYMSQEPIDCDFEFKTKVGTFRSLELGKDLCRYGQNAQICQLQGRGTENPHSFTETQYVFDFFVEILFFPHKTWGHDQI